MLVKTINVNICLGRRPADGLLAELLSGPFAVTFDAEEFALLQRHALEFIICFYIFTSFDGTLMLYHNDTQTDHPLVIQHSYGRSLFLIGTLWYLNIANWKSPCWMGESTINGPFSIAMLVITRWWTIHIVDHFPWLVPVQVQQHLHRCHSKTSSSSCSWKAQQFNGCWVVSIRGIMQPES